LDDQSSYQPIRRQKKPPWFPTNTIGKPRGVWPTFVSFPGAHAFQGDGPSLVYRHVSTTWDEPSPKEKEKVMGFQIGIINHTKVVATLALGLQPRQGVARLQAKREARESCRMLPGVQGV
jgi:hypothetical protein